MADDFRHCPAGGGIRNCYGRDARVSGETAPLLFTAFGSRFFPRILNEPIASLTVRIYNYAISPHDEWHAQAWAATLVLMTLILSINIIVRFVTRKRF